MIAAFACLIAFRKLWSAPMSLENGSSLCLIPISFGFSFLLTFWTTKSPGIRSPILIKIEEGMYLTGYV